MISLGFVMLLIVQLVVHDVTMCSSVVMSFALDHTSCAKGDQLYLVLLSYVLVLLNSFS